MSFKIYTKTGDAGLTGLIGGTRIPKAHIRIESYGTVDELNSHLGLVKDTMQCPAYDAVLKEVQDILFTIGSSLACDPEKEVKMSLPNLYESDVEFLEQHIDAMNEELPPLQKFILPGGHVGASNAHVARCVCRRAERVCVAMQYEGETISPLIIKYINRLSDFLFTLCRYISHVHQATEVEWTPRAAK